MVDYWCGHTMYRLCGVGVVTLILIWAPLSEAGGVQPLACSQGDEIRTIDYYMDINMDRMLKIQAEDLDEASRQQALDANTLEFVELQERRERLTQECAQQIKTRNEYYQQ